MENPPHEDIRRTGNVCRTFCKQHTFYTKHPRGYELTDHPEKTTRILCLIADHTLPCWIRPRTLEILKEVNADVKLEYRNTCCE